MTLQQRMPASLYHFMAVAAALPLFGMLAFGQFGNAGQKVIENQNQRVGDEGLLMLSVRTDPGNKPLDRQAVVKITNPVAHTVSWKTTNDKSEVALNLSFGQYEVEVSAVGYVSAEKNAQIVNLDAIPMEIDLRRDPTAIDFDVSDSVLPSKVRGDVKHAVSALKSSNFKDAKKNLDAAYKLAPENPDVNYLMGYLFYQQKDPAHAQPYLTAAANIDSRSPRVLTLLGNVQLSQKNYAAAATNLEKVADSNSSNWIAHNLLASAYLGMKKYDRAGQEAELAIAQGKANATGATLVLGQALANQGKRDDSIRVLQGFIQNSPSDPAVPAVKEFIARIQALNVNALPGSAELKTGVAAAEIDPIFSTPELPVSVSPWHPAGVDESKPAVSEGASCPFDNVIQMSGLRVKELVDNVSRIAAIEKMEHEQVTEVGSPTSHESRNYDYEVSISDDGRGGLMVDEDRFERLTRAQYPDGIATTGFAALALIFHPSMRDSFDMTCEGLGRWHGRAAWLVHFRQRDDRDPRLMDFKMNDVHHPVHLKGRAWITADKFEIVRIESEITGPMPDIKLRYQQQIVEYGAVQFPNKNMELWLPSKAEIYLDFRKHRYYRSHTYDHYMLFAVDSQEKRKEPTAPPPTEKVPPN